MPVVPISLISRDLNSVTPSFQFSEQWKNPTDVFSVLLILGGDVIARALAQLTGSRITPVTFSFGWVAYAVMAVVSAVGENKLMPQADCSCQVINAESGYVRMNSSWVIGRIVRDFDRWKDEKVSKAVMNILDEGHKHKQLKANSEQPGSGNKLKYPRKVGLCISIYKADWANIGYPGYDYVYWIGCATPICQLGIAAIPCGIFGDWSIILITIIGIILSFITGSLSQWKQEKWACREKSTKDVILTRGNGSQHAIVILGTRKGIDFEDLAADQVDIDVSTSWKTRFILILLAILWILLLISASSIKQNTWFLLAIGGLGIFQNIFSAGASRTPKAYGLPLIFEDVFGSHKTMEALFAVEEKYPRIGANLVSTFFPGGKLRDDEQKRWSDFANTAEARYKKWKAGPSNK